MTVFAAGMASNHLLITNCNISRSDADNAFIHCIALYSYTFKYSIDSLANVYPTQEVVFQPTFNVTRFPDPFGWKFTHAIALINATNTLMSSIDTGASPPAGVFTKRHSKRIDDADSWAILQRQLTALIDLNQVTTANAVCKTDQYLNLRATFDPASTFCNGTTVPEPPPLEAKLYCTGSGSIDSSCLSTNANSSTNLVEITSTQSWTAPAGVTRVIVHACGGGAGGSGGGGGGGGSTTTAASGGGSSHNGGSAYIVTTTFTVVPGTVYSITIGAGGTGGAGGAGGGANAAGTTGVTGTAGGQGGTTSFGSLAHFGGGFSGPGGNPGSLGGAGGTSGNYLAQTNYGGLMPTGANGGVAGGNGSVPSLIVQNTNPQLMLTTDGNPPTPGVGGVSCSGCGGGGGAARGAFGPIPTAVVGAHGGDGGANGGSAGSAGQDGASISNFPGQGGMGGGGGGGGGVKAATGSSGGRGGNGSNGGRGKMVIVY